MCVNFRHTRPHRKSRLGCRTCKARKIKCDEVRPVCGNCTKRYANAELECKFDALTPRDISPRAGGSMATSSPSPSISLYPAHSHDSPVSRPLELRLFHHYATITSQAMPLCEEAAGCDMWGVTVPSIAFNCEYVYDAVLGITALHLLSLSPDDATLRTAAFHYIDGAVSSQREEISQVNASNAQSLVTTAILLAIHTMVRSHGLKTGSAPYTPPLDFFYLVEGVRDILSVTRQYIDGSGIEAYIEWKPEPLSNSHHGGYEDCFVDDPLFALDSLGSTTPDKREIYNQALQRLTQVKEAIKRGEKAHWIRRHFSTLPSFIHKDFVRLVEEQDAIAIAILGRFYAMMKFVDETWWLRGMPEYEVMGLASLVGPEEAWMMEWPLGVLQNCSS